MEQDRYGDLVQENYIDSYRNLTHKAVSALKYISLHCSQVTYVLKTDDDVFVQIFALLHYLVGISGNSSIQNGMIITPRYKHQEDFISCLVWHKMQVDRNPGSKWFVPDTIWNETYFPPYCSGAAFLTSGRTVKKLFQKASQTLFFWIDDVYVTGILAAKVKIKRLDLSVAYRLRFTEFYQRYQNQTAVASERIPWIFSHIDDFSKIARLWKVIFSSAQAKNWTQFEN